MITKAEYLKAKAIVEQYEREELEQRCEHWFRMIPGSGKLTGTPTWKCKHCSKTVVSS